MTLIRKAPILDSLDQTLYDNYTGRALLLSQDFAGAIHHLRECARRLPDPWGCHQSLATAYLYAGQADAAAREFAEMMRSFPFKSVGALGRGPWSGLETISWAASVTAGDQSASSPREFAYAR